MNKNKITCAILAVCMTVPTSLEPLNVLASEISEAKIQSVISQNKEYPSNTIEKENTQLMENDKNNLLNQDDTNSKDNTAIPSENKENESIKEPIKNPPKEENENKDGENQDNKVELTAPMPNNNKNSREAITPREVVVDIPDARLKSAMNSALGQGATADLTQTQLATIKSLYMANTGITNLEGIQYCTGLINLDLRYNQLSDISKIANLTNLTMLYLGGNRVTNVSDLLNLTNLVYLDIGYNSIANINQLEVLKKLESIDFTQNTLSDISVLDKLPNLKRVYFGNNNITDISVIERLPGLIDLFMYNCNISNIEVVRNLTSLTRLVVTGSHISDISVINNLNSLNLLSFSQNQITDITPILNKTTIQTLDLNYNQITDISPISTLTNLNYLGLGNNKISNLTPLKNLTTLNNLMLDGNKITDISEISALTNLGRLTLSANTINDISILANMTKLYTLSLTNNKITDISPIKNLVNLTELSISNNNVEDISHLSKMTKLCYLYFGGNKVSNIDVLANMPSLAYLDISANKISDIRVVSGLTRLYYFWGHGQILENTQPIYSNGNIAVVKNSLIDKNGNVIAPVNIPNEGLYDSAKNETTWTNITNDTSLTYSFSNEFQTSGNKVYFSGTVKNNIKYDALPTISAEDKMIFKGEAFDPLNAVTATDSEDGDITANIRVIENTVDVLTPGNYKVVYEITDSRGSKVTKTINVVVKIKMSGMNSVPVIEALNKEFYEGESFDPLKDVLAKDKEDGDITNSISIVENTVNTTTPGDYKVLYEVIDSQGAKAKKLISVKVKKNNAPIITANNIEIIEGDTFDPLKNIIATDAEDGDITNKIVIVENTVNNKVPGTYRVVYEVVDRIGLKTVKEIQVKVKLREVVVVVPDGEVKESLNELLGQGPNAELTDVKLKEIKEIDLSNKNVKNLKGLEYCINLEKLYLPQNNIADLGNLKDLKKLKVLDLSENKIKDINTIKDIETLEVLNISKNQVEKIDGIENLKNLKELNISGNLISDISSLEKIPTLSNLSLGGEKITDDNVENVNKLTSLKVLNIKDSNITNTENVAKLKSLEELSLTNNKISDVSHIKELNNLKYLNLEKNKISKIDNLVNLTSLKGLNLNENKITDISNLSKLSGYSYITAQNQYIDTMVDIYSLGNVAETINKIIDINGQTIELTNIEGEGLYQKDSKKIEWKNIKADTKYKYEFNNMKKDVKESRGYAMERASNEVPFSGTVVQNIRFNDLPTINVNNKVIKLNEKFDPLKDVTAKDREDGDITKNIKVTENTVDTSKIGNYKVSYEVLDSKGAKGIKTIKVDVKEELPKTGVLGSISLLGGLIVGAGATLIGKRRKNK